jgi:hypothetical protein
MGKNPPMEAVIRAARRGAKKRGRPPFVRSTLRAAERQMVTGPFFRATSQWLTHPHILSKIPRFDAAGWGSWQEVR